MSYRGGRMDSGDMSEVEWLGLAGRLKGSEERVTSKMSSGILD